MVDTVGGTTEAGPLGRRVGGRPAGAALAWGRRHPAALLGGAAVLVVLLAAGWYLVSPLFVRTQLVEPAGPGAEGVVLAQGRFADRDAVHRGAGLATLQRDPGGRTSLRLEQFRVTNGPDLYVYLTPQPMPETHDDVTREGLSLGHLKASQGAFSYELPADADPSRYRAAVVYCYQFRTIFSVAPLAAR